MCRNVNQLTCHRPVPAGSIPFMPKRRPFSWAGVLENLVADLIRGAVVAFVLTAAGWFYARSQDMPRLALVLGVIALTCLSLLLLAGLTFATRRIRHSAWWRERHEMPTITFQEMHPTPAAVANQPLSAPESALPALRLSAEDAPGAALVRVDNLGERALFTATATVLAITERVTNPVWRQTYALRWRSNGREELTIPSASSGSLLIASTGQPIREAGSDVHELLLEGYVDGQAAIVDRRRWIGGEPPGAVRIDLAVTVASASTTGSVTECFVVKSGEWGGLTIEKPPAAEPLADGATVVQLRTYGQVLVRTVQWAIDFLSAGICHDRAATGDKALISELIEVEVLKACRDRHYRLKTELEALGDWTESKLTGLSFTFHGC